MEQTDDYFEIKVTHRSLGAGLNEIFVESDELEAIKQLGNLMKMIYSEATLLLKMQTW
jgi:3-dehydroquinate synthase class II